MAGRGDIQAGRAFVELFVKKGAWASGLAAASNILKTFGSGIVSIGKLVADMGVRIGQHLLNAVKHFMSAGSALADMSARTGVAASSLGELKFAAEQSGASIEDVETAIRMMQKKGIKGTFDEVAAKIAAIQDPAKRTQAAIENWGKSGTKLLPMIENLAALRKEARDLGLAPSDEAVEMADRLGDAWDAVQSVIGATAFEIGSALAPAILPVLEIVRNIGGAFNRWLQGGGIQNTLDALVQMVPVLGTIGEALGGIADALIAGQFQLAVEIAAGSMRLAFLEAVDGIMAQFGALGDAVLVFSSKILQGDLAGAFDVVIKGAAALWDAFVSGMVDAFADAMRQIESMWRGVAAGISTAMGGLGAALGSLPGGGAIAGALGGAAGALGAGGLPSLGAAGSAVIGSATAAVGAAASAQQRKAEGSLDSFLKSAIGGADEARAELDQLRAELAAMRAFAASAAGAGPGRRPDVSAESLAEAKFSTVTFSGAALLAAGQGGGGPAQRIAKATEKTVEKLDVLHQDHVTLKEKLNRKFT
jgi:hypothetical protein